MVRGTRLLFVLVAAVLVAALAPCYGGSTLSQTTIPIIVGYFPQWGLYSSHPYYVKTLVTNGAAERLGQINYAQGAIRNGRCSVADPSADLQVRFTREDSVNGKPDGRTASFRGYFHQFEELKHRYPHLKLLISLEGDAREFARDAQEANRKAFVASCVDTFLRGHFAPNILKPGLFDGIDVDWESPSESETADFHALLEEFRRQMDAFRPGLRLSIAVDESPQTFSGTNFGAIAALVDQVGVMNYDYIGPWSSTTGLLAPLFSTDPHDVHTVERSIASYEAAGVPAPKLLMGLPFYGYSWTDVEFGNNGLFQTGRAIRGDRPYSQIRSVASDFFAYREEHSQAPWLFDGRTFWTYEDPVSVRYKASYASHQHLGGVMIWELSGDTPDAELLNVVYDSLREPLEEKVFKKRMRQRPSRGADEVR